MASEAKSQEPTTTHHSTPAGGVISVQHVETSTESTQEAPPHKPQEPIMVPKSEETPVDKTITHSPQQQQQQDTPDHDIPPMLVVTESGPSESTKAAQDGGDSGSVVSMPAAVPSSAMESQAEFASSMLLASPETDAGSVASAPAVVEDIDGGIGSVELEDIMSSPHGNNAIVERSPGGRYVRFMEKLGSGASKDVYRAYDTQEGIEVAWNVVHLAGVPKNERNRIVNEVRLLERLHHHNIISFHGSWVNREKQQVNFVTEILSSGTLKSFINKVQVIRWKIAKRWALQILKGLEYLHSQEPPVIHRDLKCENIFINGTSGDLRIGDLGLSTVHRNGKALSVLGTPEFMAPDMYEENAYDEKVDIYAFGMCLLEIFTKEIPYRECNNPAQIYKKVTRGDPPESLKRLKSRHAREFIKMCLGIKGEDGNYVRPSATELIAHPFLQQRPSDDDEVEVEPPMNERTIKEVPETSSGGAKGASKTTRSQSSKPMETAQAPVSSPAVNKLDPSPSSSSLTEDESDRFDEMPDSEMSFRKPKVLMGRGQELQRDENDDPVQTHERTGSGDLEGEGEAQVAQQAGQPISEQQAGPAPAQSPASAFHFLVAAAVIEDEYAVSRPYDDDVLKLVVTLPVEGQTQNVQFDFHLVQDDPIQVAKEMVAELGIPQAAVLEISETISGLARAARIKQDKYMARMNKPATHSRSRSESHGNFSQSHGTEMIHGQTIGHAPQSQSHQSIPDYMGGQLMQGAPAQEQSPHVHGQQMTHQGSMPQMHMHPQHQASGDSLSSLPLNSQMQNLSVGQQMGNGDQTIQTAPAHVGHGQHQQQNWNPHPGQNGPSPAPPPPDSSRNIGPQNYGHAPLVRSLSADVTGPAPTYAQVPMQQGQMANQQHGQQGVDSQGAYGQAAMQQAQPPNHQQVQQGGGQLPMQHAQATNNQQQVQQGVGQIPMHHAQAPNQQQAQQGGGQISMQHAQVSNQQQVQQGAGQIPMQHAQVPNQQQVQQGGGQVPMQHAQVPNQPQTQSGGQQSVDGQSTYNQAQMQHAQVPNQLQAQSGQPGEGQGAYNQAQMQHTQVPKHQQQAQNIGQSGEGHGAYNQAQMQHSQVLNQQQVQSVGQPGDGQGAYNPVQMQHTQVPNQQQAQNGQPGEGQGAYNQVQMQHTQVPNQQQAQSVGQPGEGQGAYNQGQMQHSQVPNQQQAQSMGQPGEVQGAYSQAQVQHSQVPNQQQAQSVGQPGEVQGAYNHAQMQHSQVPIQQQAQSVGQPGEVQGAYNPVQMQHTQVPNQQQAQSVGQPGEGQGAYNQAQMQHTQVPNQQQAQSTGQGYNQAQMQHTQVPNQLQAQSGGQQDGQGQGPTAYMNNPQNQDHAAQAHVAAPAPYGHQSQNQGPLPSQGIGQGMLVQGNSGHVGGGYDYQATHHNESSAGQSQYLQSSTHSMQQHSMQQNPNQQMHVMSQNAQNQGYGPAVGQQQSHPVAQQPQPQHQQQIHAVPPQNPQGPAQPPQHQQFVPNQPQAVPQHQGVPADSQQQQPAPSGPPNTNANVEASSNIPIQIPTDPALAVDEVTAQDTPAANNLMESSSFADDQVISQYNHMNGVLGVPSIEIDVENLDDEEIAAELRKLDEDFQKHMMRAQKVFDSRMDNLQRTQVQREVQHQKTLEKHQKERADFEKRRQQEEIEQNRRIEQLQKDWERRREAMRQQQLAEAQAAENSALSSSTPETSSIDAPDGSSAQ